MTYSRRQFGRFFTSQLAFSEDVDARGRFCRRSAGAVTSVES